MKKTSLFALVIIYLLMFIVQVITLPASRWSVLLLILTAVIGYTHTHYAGKRNRKIAWSEINRPFAIVDWGGDGKAFELPEHHSGFYIACSAAKVYDTTAFVRYSLAGAGNEAFLRSNMPVLEFYFRKGAHVLETQEQYRDRVLHDFDKALVEWHTKLEKQEAAYRKAYLSDNQNGSKPE